MTPWLQSQIAKNEVALFGAIQRSVQVIPDLDLGTNDEGNKIVLSCHMLARATGKIFGLPVYDGYFYEGCSHSWLVLPSRHIIDVYPVGMLGGPILVGYRSPAFRLYKKENTQVLSKYSALRFGHPCFKKAVRAITHALNKSLV